MEVKPGVSPSVTCHNVPETCLPTGVGPDSPCPAVSGAVPSPVLPAAFPDQAPRVETGWVSSRVARQKISGEERSEYANARRGALHSRASRDSSPQASPVSRSEVQQTKRDAHRKSPESERGQTPDEAGATHYKDARCVRVAPASPILRRHEKFTEIDRTFSNLHCTLRGGHGEQRAEDTVHTRVHPSVRLEGNAKLYGVQRLPFVP